jgi:hypothetical protein
MSGEPQKLISHAKRTPASRIPLIEQKALDEWATQMSSSIKRRLDGPAHSGWPIHALFSAHEWGITKARTRTRSTFQAPCIPLIAIKLR